MKRISVVTPVYNEEENVRPFYEALKSVFARLPGYHCECLFIDNASTDQTVPILKELARDDKNVKIIVNARNFGPIRSPYYGMLQAQGDAVIVMAVDFQDPPEMIPEFVRKWEEGFRVVIGVKKHSKENPLMFAARKFYYRLIEKIAETEHVSHFTGYGLYDREFVRILEKLDDPYPYFRGIVASLGFERAEVAYEQPKRQKGKSKADFYTLFNQAMLGFVNHSKVPLRLATFVGFMVAGMSFLVALGYLIYKIFFWADFDVGIAPLVIGLFFFSSIQLIFIGILGEYVGAIYTQTKKIPLVIEKERINF